MRQTSLALCYFAVDVQNGFCQRSVCVVLRAVGCARCVCVCAVSVKKAWVVCVSCVCVLCVLGYVCAVVVLVACVCWVMDEWAFRSESFESDFASGL